MISKTELDMEFDHYDNRDLKKEMVKMWVFVIVGVPVVCVTLLIWAFAVAEWLFKNTDATEDKCLGVVGLIILTVICSVLEVLVVRPMIRVFFDSHPKK